MSYYSHWYNNINFIGLKHTIKIASQYKETAQLDTEKGIARTGSASTKKTTWRNKKQYIYTDIAI
jgi:hypothetical protein